MDDCNIFALGSIFYTSINIPYGSMASAISAEAEDRASLSTWRTIGATLAGLVIGVGTPLVAYVTVDGKNVIRKPYDSDRRCLQCTGNCMLYALLYVGKRAGGYSCQ